MVNGVRLSVIKLMSLEIHRLLLEEVLCGVGNLHHYLRAEMDTAGTW